MLAIIHCDLVDWFTLFSLLGLTNYQNTYKAKRHVLYFDFKNVFFYLSQTLFRVLLGCLRAHSVLVRKIKNSEVILKWGRYAV